MPFLVTCQCGKKLRVADENQGKKVRCPACQALVVAQPEPAASPAAAPKARDSAPEVKRRPAPAEDETNGAPPPKRPRREEEEDEDRPAKKRRPEPDEEEEDRPRSRSKSARKDDEDEAPARSRKRSKRDDEDDDDDDRRSRKGKTKTKSSAKTLLLVGCGCGSLLFLSCAGVIALAVIYGNKAPDEQLAGSWEVDRDGGAPIPDQFAKDKTFGFQFNKDDGTFYEDWNGSVHKGKWRADKGDKPGEVFALISYPPKTSETILKFRPVDKDHIIFNHSGQEVTLKRSQRQLAQMMGESKQPEGDGAGKGSSGKGGDTAKAGDSGKGGSVLTTLKEHTKDVVSLSFGNSDTLASASWDGTVKVWDLATGSSKHTLKGHTGQVHSVAFLPDGKQLISAGGKFAMSGEVKLWDAATGTEKSTLAQGQRPYMAVAAARGPRPFVAWSDFGDAVVWDLTANKQRGTLAGHSNEVAALAFNESGRGVAAVGGSELKLWDIPAAAAKPPASRLSNNVQTPPLHCVAISPDGKMVAAGSEGIVYVWEMASGGQMFALKGKDLKAPYKGVAFSPDSRSVVAAGGTVNFWDAKTGTLQAGWDAEKDGHFAYSVAVSPDGKKVATGALNGSIKVWDTTTWPAGKR